MGCRIAWPQMAELFMCYFPFWEMMVGGGSRISALVGGLELRNGRDARLKQAINKNHKGSRSRGSGYSTIAELGAPNHVAVCCSAPILKVSHHCTLGMLFGANSKTLTLKTAQKPYMLLSWAPKAL